MRLLLPALLAASLALLLAPAAEAARVSVTNGVLVLAEELPQVNRVTVLPYVSSYANGYIIYDDRSPLAAGPGCFVLRSGPALCLADVTSAQINAGAYNDTIILRAFPLRAVVNGGPGDDLIETGPASDVIDGGDGADTVYGNGGDDLVDGGVGSDRLEGGAGGDVLDGRGGDDVLEGQAGGGDRLSGGEGQDLMSGGDGNDLIDGGNGADALVAGGGTDTLAGGAGPDQIVVTGPQDTVVAPRGNDEVGRQGLGTSDRCERLRHVQCWPATDPPGPVATAADVPPVKPPVSVIPLRAGRATYLSVRVKDVYVYTARVRISTYDRSHRLLTRFYASVKTRNAVKVRMRGAKGLKTYFAAGSCCY